MENEVRNGNWVRDKKYFTRKYAEHYARNKEKFAQKRLVEKDKIREKNARVYQKRKALKKQREGNTEQSKEDLERKKLEEKNRDRERLARNYKERKALKKQKEEALKKQKEEAPKNRQEEEKNPDEVKYVRMMGPGRLRRTQEDIRRIREFDKQQKIMEN